MARDRKRAKEAHREASRADRAQPLQKQARMWAIRAIILLVPELLLLVLVGFGAFATLVLLGIVGCVVQTARYSVQAQQVLDGP